MTEAFHTQLLEMITVSLDPTSSDENWENESRRSGGVVEISGGHIRGGERSVWDR
ncbi:MAG: hypothetical protein SPK85_07695 [Prevotella sp.]|nr:hypothetical protein [Prevotella sp.]MDY6438980.1 hypothetical protein [Prevotella sp.]